MAQTQTEKPLDYYKRRSRYLRRRYGRKLTADNWAGGEIDVGDGIILEEYDVMSGPGEFMTLYVLLYVDGDNPRIVAVYDDMHVANEVARIVHEVLRLERLERRRRRRSK
jgi:hypothetical protein